MSLLNFSENLNSFGDYRKKPKKFEKRVIHNADKDEVKVYSQTPPPPPTL